MKIDGHRLAATNVLDTEGGTVRLGSLWDDRVAVVVWLRHFGCLFCRQQVAELRPHEGDFEARGARLVFIGNGSPTEARTFRDEWCAGCTLLTDPHLRSYREIGARSGVASTLGPRAWVAGIRAFAGGARQTMVKGAPFQQGGVLVVAPGDDVLYSYLSKAAGDHPAVEAVLAAVPARTVAAAR